MPLASPSSEHMLTGRRIVLGITGSIAAYKSATLARELRRRGAEVRVVMTPGATEFITPLTLATLVDNPVHSDFTEDEHAGVWTNHVELGIWGDLILIAPATANTLAAMVHGQCNNLLQAVLLSARCPVAVAPAMDLASGYPIEAQTADNIEKGKERIKEWPYAKKIFLPHLGEEREAPYPGEIFVQTDLLATLQKLSKRLARRA